jgi:hypothetical protein
MIRTLVLAAGLTFAAVGLASAQTEKPKAAAQKAAAAKAGDAKAAAEKPAAAAKAAAGKAAGKTAKTAEKPAAEKSASGKGAKAKAVAAGAAAGGGKPTLVAAHGDWGAYLAQGGRGKVCYALAQPKQRQPAGLKRGDAYIFISTRPAENVRGEVSIMMGFPLKEGAAGAAVEIGSQSFDLVVKGENAWVKNAAEETQLAEAMRKGSRLVVKAPSAKGVMMTDTYSLSGLAAALDQVRKDCN